MSSVPVPKLGDGPSALPGGQAECSTGPRSDLDETSAATHLDQTQNDPLDEVKFEERRYCAVCLEPIPPKDVKENSCQGCCARAYCSSVCRRNDATRHGDCRLFKWGEEGIDWKVTEVEGKGQGVRALHTMPPQFRIMIDWRIPKSDPLVDSIAKGLPGENLEQRLKRYTFKVGENEEAFFLRISLINHDCDANAYHMLEAKNESQVMMIVAKREIKAGEEITIRYMEFHNMGRSEDREGYRAGLQENWGIVCSPPFGVEKLRWQCRCQKDDLEDIFKKAKDLDIKIKNELRKGPRPLEDIRILKKVDQLLNYSTILDSPIGDIEQVLSDGYNLALMRKFTFDKAMQYASKLISIFEPFSPPGDLKMQGLKELKDSPDPHLRGLRDRVHPIPDETLKTLNLL